MKKVTGLGKRETMVRVLLGHGAAPDSMRQDGQRAADCVVKYAEPGIVKLLYEEGKGMPTPYTHRVGVGNNPEEEGPFLHQDTLLELACCTWDAEATPNPRTQPSNVTRVRRRYRTSKRIQAAGRGLRYRLI